MDLDEALDHMEMNRKKEVVSINKIYLSFMKSFLAINDKNLVAINHKALIKSEYFINKMIDDLKLIIELIQNYDDR